MSSTDTDTERDAHGYAYVTIDQIAEARRDFVAAHDLDGTPADRRAAMSWRNLLAKRALRQGMHPATVANYAGISERYARSLVKASER